MRPQKILKGGNIHIFALTKREIPIYENYPPPPNVLARPLFKLQIFLSFKLSVFLIIVFFFEIDYA